MVKFPRLQFIRSIKPTLRRSETKIPRQPTRADFAGLPMARSAAWCTRVHSENFLFFQSWDHYVIYALN